ncbi:uncharacterized protein LOC126909140 [Daktulosphaira vitifoliae]|uniref:uncharacterized protein LOC126909140 n=1 Tax=Daktulosphaira vitifoliae TaxID=58002 RepID=UPI0021A9A7B8|nr:uncharacterized protein LOC126909140 [Daktulosphaira vitifoliae]XP_050547526.1 uncharacterized protein LOC126909140 [Daktulosphaira vitifoliae]XP_050547530.1 uncharacterized protein LOC126909140 [Daktulosphaira vitifoliae]XP_050547535.1 uncharacterized protein LOC126909140 [Daktulosphaira vitifoliae]
MVSQASDININSSDPDDIKCCICLEVIIDDKNDFWCCKRCNNCLHYGCILKWHLQSGNILTCPYCRDLINRHFNHTCHEDEICELIETEQSTNTINEIQEDSRNNETDSDYFYCTDDDVDYSEYYRKT